MEHNVDIYNKHLPRCTASYVIKQMPITTTRYQCPPLKMAQIQDADRQHQMLLKVWGSKASAFVGREAKQPQLWWLPVILNILPPSSPAHVYPKELETVSKRKPTRADVYHSVFSKSKWVFKPWRKTTEYLEMNGVNSKWLCLIILQNNKEIGGCCGKRGSRKEELAEDSGLPGQQTYSMVSQWWNIATTNLCKPYKAQEWTLK